ncbi:hypothetical protein CN526_23065 [Bacillus wiedmannii]|uniref:MAE_28990/MAE_18760 family HEPN-like nuclease n=1 Tax=Bacillus wiedmannii TaxID=1890302 RepID=UPI000BFA5124|nr:MAE_28990/MAE_18760 family HEPN-like nuclease [Bacillus wiedmannii]PEU23148.1 hypothetical protein CN526_23065 [Bacillus wiedmannii]
MKYSLIEFDTSIQKLEFYIDGIIKHRKLFKDIREYEKSNGLLEQIFIDEVKDLLNESVRLSNKVFEYNSIIISLYGILENFIESLIKEYIQFLNDSIPKYNDLPQEIKKNHYEFSANLINNLKLPKYKDITTKELIVSNLYSCSNCLGMKEYKINLDAFTHHTSNFRSQSVNEIFKNVGISNITSSILRNKNFKIYMEEEGIESGEEFSTLNDLAERRNRISHGSEESDILDIVELIRYIKYIKKLAHSLNFVIYEHLAEQLVVYGDNLLNLGKPIKKFASKIAGIEVHGKKVTLNDDVIILKEDKSCTVSKIISMQIDGIDYPEIDTTTEKYQIGVVFDCNISENFTFYLLNEK